MLDTDIEPRAIMKLGDAKNSTALKETSKEA